MPSAYVRMCALLPTLSATADQACPSQQDPLSGARHVAGLLLPPLLHIREPGPLW